MMGAGNGKLVPLSALQAALSPFQLLHQRLLLRDTFLLAEILQVQWIGPILHESEHRLARALVLVKRDVVPRTRGNRCPVDVVAVSIPAGPVSVVWRRWPTWGEL
jgi:hypothetical protein